MKAFGNERFRLFANYLQINERIYNDSDLCKKLGKRSSQISELFTGKRTVTPAFAYQLESVFPDLNPEYLIKEECDQMLKAQIQVNGDQNNVNNGHDQCIHQSADVERLLSIIEKQQVQIDTLIKMLAEK